MSVDLRIAVLSDTHNRVPEHLPARIESADEIWHLGDVCRPETLEAFAALPGTLTVVRGNCDSFFHWDERAILERHGLRFQLQHLPPQQVDRSLTALLFGHLHYPVKERLAEGLALNPGAITGPRNGSGASFAWLTISPEGNWAWDLCPL